jgi:hypothetical protein
VPDSRSESPELRSGLQSEIAEAHTDDRKLGVTNFPALRFQNHSFDKTLISQGFYLNDRAIRISTPYSSASRTEYTLYSEF